MSLYKRQENDFQALDIQSLDSFADEISHRTDGDEPDLERFRVLFDQKSTKDAVLFESIHPDPRDTSQDVFEGLIDIPEDRAPEVDAAPEAAAAPGEAAPETADAAPAPDPEAEQALRVAEALEEAQARGLAQGYEEGQAKGYEEGLAKGMEEGRSQGEAQGREAGYQDGFAQGETEGRTAGEETAKQAAEQSLEALTQALTAVNNLTNDLVDSHEDGLLALVFQVAERVIQVQLDNRDDIVRSTIIDALKSLVRPDEVRLSVSPEDYEYVEMIKDSFFESVSSLEHVSVQSDPQVNRGGCKIETSTASVATDPATKLAAIRDAFEKDR